MLLVLLYYNKLLNDTYLGQGQMVIKHRFIKMQSFSFRFINFYLQQNEMLIVVSTREKIKGLIMIYPIIHVFFKWLKNLDKLIIYN